MKILYIALVALFVYGALGFEEGDDVEKIVAEINSQNDVSWTASLDYAREVPLSVFVERAKNIRQSPREQRETFRKTESSLVPNVVLPDTYDLRDHYPNCSNIGQIQQQGSCGSCWSFASTGVAVDRLCISKGVTMSPSPQYTMDCDQTCYAGLQVCNNGCKGGFPDLAYQFMASTAPRSGFVAGACRAYQADPSYCHTRCDDGSSVDRHHVVGRAWLPNERTVMEDILLHGPVSATFLLYEDFRTYHTGVYHHRTGGQIGGHAVKVIGWGAENGEKYWLGVNSWGKTHGQQGTFKFRRGQNDCLFEEDMWAPYFQRLDIPAHSRCSYVDPGSHASYAGQCYPIKAGTLKYCKHVDYTSCVYWDAAVADKICMNNHALRRLGGGRCADAFKAYCCSMMLPQCVNGTVTARPVCRKACTDLQSACGSRFQVIGCEKLPVTQCFAPSSPSSASPRATFSLLAMAMLLALA